MCSTEIFILIMGEKKENPCVWYSWNVNIFNTFVKQGNGEVSNERQNAAVPTQPSTGCALTCLHTAKSLGGVGCHVSHKFHSTCGTQFSRDWEVSLQPHCLLTDPQFSSELTRGDCHWAKERCWISRRLRNLKIGSQCLVLRVMLSTLRQITSHLHILYSSVSWGEMLSPRKYTRHTSGLQKHTSHITSSCSSSSYLHNMMPETCRDTYWTNLHISQDKQPRTLEFMCLCTYCIFITFI